MTDLDKLAKSLTKAQRDWVLSPERDISEVTDQAARPEHEWDTLAALNVAEYWTDRLTPLGLALRNHLKGQNDGQ